MGTIQRRTFERIRFIVFLIIVTGITAACCLINPCPNPQDDILTQLANISTYQPGRASDLVKDDIWFRDADGRYVLLRGVNFAGRAKLPPYLPIMPLDAVDLNQTSIDRFHQELNAVKPQIARLKRLGFNIVRLPVMWKAIEPRPNPNLEELLPEGVQYLGLVKEVIDALYDNGLFVIIDFHQDIAHEFYGGDGFPDWALAIDDQHRLPSPPSDLKDPRWGLNYYDTIVAGNHDLVRHTLQSFWRNLLYNSTHTETERVIFSAQNPRTHLERTIGATARYFQALNGGKGHPAIIGYEPFNEPHPVGLGKQNFEASVLPEFYINVLREIQRSSTNGLPGDTKAFLFVEPRMDWTTYNANAGEQDGLNFTLTPESYLDTSGLSGGKIVFSFHYYDPWTITHASSPSPFFPFYPHGDNMRNKQNEWPGVFSKMRDAYTSRKLIPFLTEFGGSQDWQFDTDLRPNIYQHQQIRAYMDLQFQQIEANLLNSTYWNYDLYNTATGKDNWNLENFSLLGPNRSPRHLDIVARPYPLRSTAKPKSLFFDLESKHCAIMLEGPVNDKKATVIYVPRGIHYKSADTKLDGFEVRATGSWLYWDENNQLLFWVPDPKEATNQVVISPIGAFNSSALPQDAQALMQKATLRRVFPSGQSF